MNKAELISALSERTGVSEKDVKKVIEDFVSLTMDEVKNGGFVRLVGFGTFTSSTRAAHCGHNPVTGESMEIPETKAPTFHAGRAFKRIFGESETVEEEEKTADAKLPFDALCVEENNDDCVIKKIEHMYWPF